MPLRAGDRILTGRAEYGSNVLAYLQLARRTGAEVVVVPNDESGQIDLDALRDLVDERTALIGLTCVPTAAGWSTRRPRSAGSPARPTCSTCWTRPRPSASCRSTSPTLGCDLLTGTGRKFLRGPRGTGFLWVRSTALERLEPPVVEIGVGRLGRRAGLHLAPGARRFETWETQLRQRARARRGRRAGAGARAGRRSASAPSPSAPGCATRWPTLPGVTTHDLGERTCAIVTARSTVTGGEE